MTEVHDALSHYGVCIPNGVAESAYRHRPSPPELVVDHPSVGDEKISFHRTDRGDDVVARVYEETPDSWTETYYAVAAETVVTCVGHLLSQTAASLSAIEDESMVPEGLSDGSDEQGGGETDDGIEVELVDEGGSVATCDITEVVFDDVEYMVVAYGDSLERVGDWEVWETGDSCAPGSDVDKQYGWYFEKIRYDGETYDVEGREVAKTIRAYLELKEVGADVTALDERQFSVGTAENPL
jgi:hypothetical protein